MCKTLIMKRTLYADLLRWKEDSRRKPLLVYGARQVGKTYLIKEFGNREFSNMVYINCDKNKPLERLFEENYNIERLLEGLRILTNEDINPITTLIFFDEVQEIPQIVTSLKYFCEEARDFCIVAAGSLLGVLDLKGFSFPVGKVDILHLYPMTFIEFLWAMGETKKAELLESKSNEDLINIFLPLYIDYLRQYYLVGGMPEAVKEYMENKNIDKVREIQNTILTGYYSDIAKHAGNDAYRCRMVLDSLPSQLAKENKKFVYGAIKKGGRAKEFEAAIQWLIDAGMIYKVNRLTKVVLPLKFYIDLDAFKLFLLDIGLLGALLDTPPSEILIGDNIFSEYKGAFTENYVLTQLIPQKDIVVGYYSKPNSTLEIDFVIQKSGEIYPIEVKAEGNVRSKSLSQFIKGEEEGKGLKGYRFSMKGFKDQEWMKNIPLPGIQTLLL